MDNKTKERVKLLLLLIPLIGFLLFKVLEQYITPVNYTVGECLEYQTDHINTTALVKYYIQETEFNSISSISLECEENFPKHKFFVMKYSVFFNTRCFMLFCYPISKEMYNEYKGKVLNVNPVTGKYIIGLDSNEK